MLLCDSGSVQISVICLNLGWAPSLSWPSLIYESPPAWYVLQNLPGLTQNSSNRAQTKVTRAHTRNNKKVGAAPAQTKSNEHLCIYVRIHFCFRLTPVRSCCSFRLLFCGMVTPEVVPEVPVEVTQGSIDNFVLRGSIDDFARSIQRPVDEPQSAQKSMGGVSADSHGELSLDDDKLWMAPGAWRFIWWCNVLSLPAHEEWGIHKTQKKIKAVWRADISNNSEAGRPTKQCGRLEPSHHVNPGIFRGALPASPVEVG